MEPSSPSQASSERQDGKQVLTIEVLVIGQDLVERHTRAEQVQQRLDRVTQPADTRFAVAHRGVDRDARE
jgi:hypothetical protein